MTPDVALLTGGAGSVGALLALLTQWRRTRRLARESADLRAALELHRTACSEQFASLREMQHTLEMSFQSTREVLHDSRFNRSTRAAALKLLGSGMSPDAAAASLGIARREMTMLSKISAMLTTP